jgi:hypothetical protein
MTAVILIIAGGYAVASYGWILLKGYDITFRQWVNPLNPFTWPASGAPAMVAAGSVFPTGAAGTAKVTAA